MRVLFLFLLPSLAFAHPVSFQDSIGFMGFHSKEFSEVEMNYSARPWMAYGVQMFRFTPNTSRPSAILAKANFLAKRWNGNDFQANIYTETGIGNSRITGENLFAYYWNLVADIEDRSTYFSAQYGQIRDSKRKEFGAYKARLGFAPFLGEFNSLNIWAILEMTQMNLENNRVQLIPYLRFFYKNVLWEIGSSMSGDIHFNYIIHI